MSPIFIPWIILSTSQAGFTGRLQLIHTIRTAISCSINHPTEEQANSSEWRTKSKSTVGSAWPVSQVVQFRPPCNSRLVRCNLILTTVITCQNDRAKEYYRDYIWYNLYTQLSNILVTCNLACLVSTNILESKSREQMNRAVSWYGGMSLRYPSW